MDTIGKLKILSESSQYDISCACATGKDEHRRRGTEGKWLYPTTLPQGGYSILLKTLMSNHCSNDCKYCPLRGNSNMRRCALTPEETVDVFMKYRESHHIFGLFLSSGVLDSPDRSMDRMIAAAEILRKKRRFKGYIHLKIIPGASTAAIDTALSLSSAVSLNIETPGERHFKILSDRKDYNRDIIEPLKYIARMTEKGSKYHRVKCTTQFIVGASDERDSDILKYSFGLYKRLNFDRIYFSAYQKGLGDPGIPGERDFFKPPEELFMREHRLYQADFLIRKYKFSENEIITGADGNLDLDKDPKEVWADRHPEFFPVDVNRAVKDDILRIPGIGPTWAERIVSSRMHRKISALSDIGLKGKALEKASKFSVCS
jgi:predicted DNA-binding helix-hairpin-helix protein